MEIVWTALLAVAYRDKQVRTLADLLVVKWALSYFGALFVGDWAPMLSDIGVALFCVGFSRMTVRRELIGWLFAATLLVHAAYWIAWERGVWYPDHYKAALAVMYTLMVFALWPWERLRAWAHRSRKRRLRGRHDLVGQPTEDRTAC